MSATAPTNEFLLKSAKKQLGFKPTAQVSLNYVDTRPPHQRYLSEQLVLIIPFFPFNLLVLHCTIYVDRIGQSPESISES